MKKWYVCFLLAALLLGTAGCSEDLYGDENIGNEWTGEGLPDWLRDRMSMITMENGWVFESYMYGMLWEAYKFEHEGKPMLVLKYEKVGAEDNWEEGTVCYAADGRKVNFSKVKESFIKKHELVWTDEICTGESIPKISYCELENPETLGWLQEVIDASCREVSESGNFMLKFAFGYCHYYLNKDYKSGGNTRCLGVEYDYADRAEKRRVTMKKLYTLDGERLHEDAGSLDIIFEKSWMQNASGWYPGE